MFLIVIQNKRHINEIFINAINLMKMEMTCNSYHRKKWTWRLLNQVGDCTSLFVQHNPVQPVTCYLEKGDGHYQVNNLLPRKRY